VYGVSRGFQVKGDEHGKYTALLQHARHVCSVRLATYLVTRWGLGSFWPSQRGFPLTSQRGAQSRARVLAVLLGPWRPEGRSVSNTRIRPRIPRLRLLAAWLNPIMIRSSYWCSVDLFQCCSPIDIVMASLWSSRHGRFRLVGFSRSGNVPILTLSANGLLNGRKRDAKKLLIDVRPYNATNRERWA
jgi:hypothetical protein